MKSSLFWSAITYIVTFFAVGIYAFPAGPPPGPMLYIGVPLLLLADGVAGVLIGPVLLAPIFDRYFR